MLSKLKSVTSKSPNLIFKIFIFKATVFFTSIWRLLNPPGVSKGEFIKLYGKDSGLDSSKIRSASHFFLPLDSSSKDVKMPAYSEEEKEKIIVHADQVVGHKFDLLGSGLVDLGQKINWHKDFISGKVWPNVKSDQIETLDLDDESDIKVPWELSRFQHLPSLGKAYLLTSDEKYMNEFVTEITDWQFENPLGVGVNWAGPMDVAIRAVNWIWAYRFFKDSESIDEKFWIEYFHSLFNHGLFLRANLERPPIRSNHYISNLVGLLFLGMFFKDTLDGRRWTKFAMIELEREMEAQVFADGVDYEGSIPYQRLVLELFLTATILLQANDGDFSNGFMKRLEKMVEFVGSYTKPDGSIPMFGDADDGRLQILSEDTRVNINDHRYLLAIGAVLFKRSDFKTAAGKFWEEAWWLLGDEGKAIFDRLPESNGRQTSIGFHDGGFFVMRNESSHLIVDCGPVGFKGGGGHGHNDALSIELFLGGYPLVTDSGTYTYSADLNARNRFRGTTAHNIIMVDDQEIAELGSGIQLWKISDVAKPRLIKFESDDCKDLFIGEHFGYQESLGVICRRSIFFDKKNEFVVVKDEIDGSGKHKLELNWHLVPSVVSLNSEKKEAIVNRDDGSSTIIKVIGENSLIKKLEDRVSFSYGTNVVAPVLQISKETDLPSELVTIFMVSNEETDRLSLDKKVQVGLEILSK